MEVTAYKREAIFIPLKGLPKEAVAKVKDKLSFKFYSQKACDKCEWRSERHSDMCDTCPAFTGGYDLASVVKVGEADKRYLKIPIGSSPKILKMLEAHHHVRVLLKDKSKDVPIKPIKFTGTLRPEQIEAIGVMRTAKRGVLKSPPRSGKTVMVSALVCEISGKTLLLASQRDWLAGFMETFIGSKTQKALTNLNPKRIGFCKTYEQFRDTDICLATVQTFYSPAGQKLLAKIRSMFHFIAADEIQTGAADKYIKIIAQLNAEYLYGVSGTPQRKDAREVLVDNVLGPIIHEVHVERMRPQVRLTRTGYSKTYKGNVMWARIVSSMENDPKRLKVIAKQAALDIAAGHLVLIPMAQVKPIAKLINLINIAAGKKVAYQFTGKEDKATRDLTIQRARDYKIKCLVGTVKILSVGINIPRASMLYETVLSSNLPSAEQRFARVLTPMEGKPAPCIRFFLDNFKIRKNCLRNEFYNCLVPKYKPIMSEKDKQLFKEYLAQETHFEKFDL